MGLSNMGRFINWLAALTLLTLGTAVLAQNPYSAAYAVNDSIITHFDIDQRMKLLRVFGIRSGDLRAAAIDQLIEDRLKLSAARVAGAAVNDEALARGIENAAANSGQTADRLWAAARGRGVSREAFEEYYEVQIIWREIVQARFRQTADPTSIDVDNAINAAAAVTQQSILLAEIALPFAERGEAATVAFAERLSRDLNNGASFEDAVRNFSRSATAANDGRIGWLPPDRLPGPIAAQVLGLRAGQVSAPVRVSTGIILLKVISSRVINSPLKKQISVSYAVLDLSGMANATSVARNMQGGLDACDPNTSNVESFGAGSGIFGPLPVEQVPTDIALVLARLMPSRSEVLVNGGSVKLVQLCERTSDLEDEVRAQISNGVFGQKLGSLAEGFLLELRRTAIIEQR